jgi:hypothetical protein
MSNKKQIAGKGTLEPLVRPWLPSNLVIKGPRRDGFKHTCDNAGCDAPGEYVFEEDNAIWIACETCRPRDAEVIVVLRPG